MQPISPRRPNALPFIQYSQRVGHSFGHVEQTPPSPKRDPLDAQAPSISLINSHLQTATGLSSRCAPVCISVALRNKINVIGRGEVNQS
ncbi:hypothetical protein CEXT_679461 [Caerostris extrusa]|uniref:Uncharacterized protein n=1 Tax=Caerostris extrusa TaxID=172846 RepID=A0AAV4Y8L1_CAEEX|nr:hypothetical protein CEXT_679461 [Caerostris extrusa]